MMPAYPFFCPEHGDFDVIRDFDEVKSSESCPTCGRVSRRKWTPVRAYFSFKAGWDNSVRKYFDSERQRDRYLAEHNLARIKD